MLPLISLLLAAQAPIDQPPRLRTLLPNGAIVLVEHVPHAKSLVVDLFVSSRGAEDMPQSEGRRHLLEHLVALGPDGRLDARVESAGGFLTARTLRDSMEFDLDLPTDGMKTGVAALKDLLAPATLDAAAIARETRIIDEESALREDDSRASAAAWGSAFGPNGTDPFGRLDVIKTTTPDDLAALHHRAFAANHLAVVVSGDVDLDAATKAISDVLTRLPIVTGDKDRLPVVPQEASINADVRGQYRGVVVSGFRSPATAATLAAALALALETPGGHVIYTPSAHAGLVILGAPDGGLTDSIRTANAAQLFTLGRVSAIRWVTSRMNEPPADASFRGMLMVSERDLRPETMIENLNALDFADFKAAVDAFKSKCVVVWGTR